VNPITRRNFLGRSGRTLGGAVLLGSGAQLLLAACGDDDDDAAPATTAAGSSAPATTAGGGGSGETTQVRVQFSWIPAAEWAPWYLADSDGYFAANGIAAGLLHGGPNTPAVTQLLAGGDAELGLSADELEVIKANGEGGDYVIIGASYQRSPFGYTWLAETDIAGPEDLVGKRIGGIQGDQIRIEAVFALNDLPVEYEFIPMSYDPQPLVDGEMDVITAYVTNQPIQLKLQGIETNSATFSDFGLTTYGDPIFTPRSWLEENHDTAVAYMKALIAGAEANIADPDKMVPLLIDKYGVDAELDADFEAEANRAYNALMESDYTATHGLYAMDPDYLADSVWPAYEAAGETDLPDIESLVDFSVVTEARG
jgi:ABC-type nitrate/sulfonate/bicarbonate transport system substrate-binding protein